MNKTNRKNKSKQQKKLIITTEQSMVDKIENSVKNNIDNENLSDFI